MTFSSSRPLRVAAFVATTSVLLSGCNKAPEPPPAVQGPAATVGVAVDDTLVTSAVKTALLADADIKSLDISVETVKGQVQLTGTVDNQGQIDQAGRIARAAEGASSVRNELRIKQ